MENRIQELLSRYDEVETELGAPDVFNDQTKYRKLTQEHSYLKSIKEAWDRLEKVKKELVDNKELLKSETDAEFVAVLEEEVAKLSEEADALGGKIENLLVPPDPDDHRATILELRAGTGGDEAALFVADCVRMYQRYADKCGWKCEPLSSTPSDAGGYKEYVMTLSGSNVHRFLQYEGGTHRVQRVPETEAQGRVHTSAITCAVLMEPDEEEDVVIDERDLDIDTFRASGAGGQHVNTTDSAVRITHRPTGVVVACQEERSQHKNKDKAIRVLKAKIVEAEREKKAREQAELRAGQVGTGDRSEKIRTYNFPQNRVTDHRINLTKYNLEQVMQGALDEMTEPLVAHFYQMRLEGKS